jgi:branched-chain amino acid transport system ATP-binding protein
MTIALRTESLVKRYSGLLATDDVTLEVEEGHIHALIGPNGAGKSTLINQLCGEIAPDSGKVFFGQRDITTLSPAARVSIGLGRTFQITSLLGEFSVRQNLGIAIQARQGRNLRILDQITGRTDVWNEVEQILAGTPLGDRGEVLVDDLSHGERKQLELLVSLALYPKILLLDEPMAGLGHTESLQMVDLLKTLRGKVTIVLVEHDMEAVFALADQISVLVYGRIILTGTARDISTSVAVREAYLGTEGDAC